MEKERYLTNNIISDLNEKMVFVGGARQVGKTTLALKLIARRFPNFAYYNWDFPPDRKKLMSFEFPGEEAILIFDEIHKYRKWKSLIKGIYDSYKSKYKIIVTGSAHLNVYKKGGDSLQGRYHYYTLHPFSLAELSGIKNEYKPLSALSFHSENTKVYTDNLNRLFKFGGFPEILFKQSEQSLRRWHNEKLERLFREDIRDLESIRDIGNVRLLGDLLPSKVASPLSINAIREDLEVSHRAVTNWLDVLELFYYHFRIYPYHSKVIRSIKKEPKLYLVDWSEVENEGARFENLIASHLLKFVQYMIEYEGYKIHLNYLRNVDKKEVDFLVSADGRPWFAVEVKMSDTQISSNISYFNERLKIPFIFQVVMKSGIDIMKDGVRVISADKFLTALV